MTLEDEDEEDQTVLVQVTVQPVPANQRALLFPRDSSGTCPCVRVRVSVRLSSVYK